MRKFLALVLALVMTMSLVTVGANAYTDDSQITNKEAVEVLSGIGVLGGYEDGSYRPQNVLTRGAGAKMVAYLVLGKTAADKLQATYTKFDDVTDSVGLAAYIEWAAAEGIIDGYGNGKFGPYNPLTEYAFGKMLLGALGYDGAEEGFTGTGWQQRVYSIAVANGVFDGSEDFRGCSRETAARMALGALCAPVVVYGTASTNGYFWNNNVVRPVQQINVSKAYETDKLLMDFYGLKLDLCSDEWGRPGHVWTYGTWSLTVLDTPVSTHNVATSECEIASDLGETKTFKVTVYDNGVVRTDEFKATNTAKTLGAQGTLIEVYDSETRGNVVVVIDTYLAYVYEATPAVKDAAGHVKTPAYTDVAIYGLENTYGYDYVYATLDTDEYAADYYLVHVNQGDKDYKQIVVSAWDAYYAWYDAYSYEIVQVADYFTGAQTKIWYNTAKHTIDGTTYDDAEHYALDDAGLTQTESFYWFKDQYGNVIGSIAMDRTSYEVLKSIVWTAGKAVATLVDMTGAERTAEVATFDEYDFSAATNAWDADNVKPALNDSVNHSYNGIDTNFGAVSTDSSLNEGYLGYALYCVYTADDGKVNLNKEYELGYNDAGVMQTGNIQYAAAAAIDTGSSVILAANGGTRLAYVNDNTQFLVRNSDGTYSAYNRNTVPELADNAEIFYTVDVKGIATRVYVKSGVLEADLGDHLFVTTDAFYREAGPLNTYVIKVMIDGVEREVLTNAAIADYLAANQGKLFHVDWELNANQGFYGFVADVRLVNEDEDSARCCDYLSGAITFSGNTLIGSDNRSYTVDSNTTIIGNNGVIDTTKGIWVIPGETKTTHADVVYVGTKLSNNTVPTVNGKYVDGNGNEQILTGVADAAGTTYTVTLPLGITSGEVRVAGANMNTVIVPLTDGVEGTADIVWSESKGADSQRVIRVYAEDGATKKDYTVVLAGTQARVPELTSLAGNQVYAYAGNDNGYATATNPYRTVYFTTSDEITVADLQAKTAVSAGTIKGYATWDAAANGWVPVTATLTVSPTADTTWVQVTVECDGTTYTFVVNTVYQA